MTTSSSQRGARAETTLPSMKSQLATGMAALFAGVASACGSSGLPAISSAAPRSPTSSQSTVATPLDLSQRLISLSDPYVQQPDAVGDTGPSDLDKAVRDQGGEPGAREELVADGFISGYQRLWRDQASHSQIIVFIYQFRDGAGADNYLTQATRTLTKRAPAGARPFAMTNLPGSFSIEAPISGTTMFVTDLVEGDYALQVVASGPRASEAVLSGLASAQIAKLKE